MDVKGEHVMRIQELIVESAPKGWEGTVKAMKKHKEIDNPWALAHYMKNKGYKSHKKESVKEEFGTNYAEQLAQKVFDQNPNLENEDDILNAGYAIAKKELGPRATGVFRDDDFASDFISAYNWVKEEDDYYGLPNRDGSNEGVQDLGCNAQSLILKLRRDVEEKRLQPTPQAVLAAARDLAGDMEFAPQLLVQQVLGKGVTEDHEIQMADSELKSIYHNSRKLLKLIQHYSEQEGLEAWQQSKITKAADYLNSVLQAVSGQQTR